MNHEEIIIVHENFLASTMSRHLEKHWVPLCLLICKGNTPSRKRWSQEWHQAIVSLCLLTSHSRLLLSLWTSSDAVNNAKDRTIWPWTEEINNRWITRLAHWSFAMLISTAFLMDYLSSLWGISKNRLYWGTWKFIAKLKWVAYLALKHRTFSNFYFPPLVFCFIFLQKPAIAQGQRAALGSIWRHSKTHWKTAHLSGAPKACCEWSDTWGGEAAAFRRAIHSIAVARLQGLHSNIGVCLHDGKHGFAILIMSAAGWHSCPISMSF